MTNLKQLNLAPFSQINAALALLLARWVRGIESFLSSRFFDRGSAIRGIARNVCEPPVCNDAGALDSGSGVGEAQNW